MRVRVGSALLIAAIVAAGFVASSWSAPRPSAPSVSRATPAPASAERPRTALPRRPRPTPAPAAARVPDLPDDPVAPDDGAASDAEAARAAEAALNPPIAQDQLGPALRDVMAAQVVEPVRACLEAVAPPEGFDGKLNLALHLDGDGLQDAAIVDLTGIPEPLLDCVGDAVWGADWPRLEDGEVDVTWPVIFQVAPEDP